MKYIITVISCVFLCALLIFIFKKLNISKKIKTTIVFTLTTVFAVFQFIFLGTNLITYSSPSSALFYCNPGETIKTQVDVDGGAFLICQVNGMSTNTTVRTTLKRGERWSSIDLNNSNGGFVRFCEDKKGVLGITISPEKTVRLGTGSTIYNSELNKSVIHCSFLVNWKNEDDSSISVKDLNGNQFILIDEDNTLIDNGLTRYEGYMVVDGEIDDSYPILIDGIEKEIYCGGIFQ